MIEFSVVVTVLNEENTIIGLLDSLSNQTKKPNEIVVVDAGSKDDTVGLTRAWGIENKNISFRQVTEDGVNRSEGRNIAITQARNEYIAVTDAGCVADKGWLKELARGFDGEEVGAVAGYYKTNVRTKLARVFSWFLAVMPEDLDESGFLPSSRSVAFTKEAWRDAGGYPEDLDYCEDLVFASRLKKSTVMKANVKALVEWDLPDNIGQYFFQVANYAQGDMEALYWPHVLKGGLTVGRWGVFLMWPWLLLIYWLYPLMKFGKKIEDFPTLFWSVMVQVVTDMAVIQGVVRGIFGRFRYQLR